MLDCELLSTAANVVAGFMQVPIGAVTFLVRGVDITECTPEEAGTGRSDKDKPEGVANLVAVLVVRGEDGSGAGHLGESAGNEQHGIAEIYGIGIDLLIDLLRLLGLHRRGC